jgi:hypothetical protein
MEQQLDYKWINTPLNLFYLMDANCTKVFITMIQMNSYYPKEDGYFECAYKTLELACGLSQNLIKASLAGLYLEGIIDVFSIGKGRGKHTNRYKVNVERFKSYEETPVGIAIMTEDKPIHQAKYKGTRFRVPWPFYKDAQEYAQHTAQSIAQSTAQKVTTNIDNITNIENIDNTKEYNIINNKEDMLVNVIEDKDTFYDDKERNVVMVIEEEKKECSDEELKTIYLNSFGEFMNNYPGLNYSLLRINKQDTFYDCYKDIVNELVMKIKNESRREDINKRPVLIMLNNYLDYIKYSYQ